MFDRKCFGKNRSLATSVTEKFSAKAKCTLNKLRNPQLAIQLVCVKLDEPILSLRFNDRNFNVKVFLIFKLIEVVNY